jgi:hypothetical protein
MPELVPSLFPTSTKLIDYTNKLTRASPGKENIAKRRKEAPLFVFNKRAVH